MFRMVKSKMATSDKKCVDNKFNESINDFVPMNDDEFNKS